MPDARLRVRVQPRARSDALVALRDGVLVIRVTSPPLEGRANEAVCRLLASVLDVRPARVTVIRGGHTRDKVVAVEGIEQAEADAAVRAATG